MSKLLSAIKYLFVLVFTLLVIVVVLIGTADVLSNQVIRYERQWIEQGAVVETHEEWKKAVERVELARELNPYNPDYPALLGRLYFWRFLVLDAPIQSYEQEQQLVNTGLQPLRDSVEMRPTFPVTWANLLRLKSLGGQIDFEFEQVWDRTVELGDWEPQVQTILLEAGLIHWPIFDDSLRQKTINIFVAMISKPYSETRALDVVAGLDAWPLMCNVLVDPVLMTVQMDRICREMRQEQLLQSLNTPNFSSPVISE